MSTVVATTYQDKNGAGHLAAGGFLKADPDSVAFTKTGNDTAEIKAGTTVAFSDGSQVNFDTATAIAMPTLSAGTDYATHRLTQQETGTTTRAAILLLKLTSTAFTILSGVRLLPIPVGLRLSMKVSGQAST